MDSHSTLVTIGKQPAGATMREKLYQAPLADKFFLCGVVFGLYGMLYLGIHLWLMMTGNMRVWESFHSLRLLHASVQMYLFFGAIILGFSLQAAPKLLEVPRAVSRYGVFLLVPLIAGVFLKHYVPALMLGSLLLAFTFIAALIFLFPLLLKAKRQNKLGIGSFLVIAFSSFAVSAFLNLGDKTQALLVFWCGVASVICAASQQFISGILGGQRISAASGVLLSICFLTAIAGLIIFLLQGYSVGWYLFSIFSLLSILLFIAATNSFLFLLHPRRSPLWVGFFCAWFWALLGAFYSLAGPSAVDQVIHMWATGWGVTLILVIMPRIVGFLGGRDVLSEQSLLIITLLWQVLPVGRGFTPGSFFVLAASIIASVIFLWWGGAMLAGIFRLLRHQAHMKSGRAMVQC